MGKWVCIKWQTRQQKLQDYEALIVSKTKGQLISKWFLGIVDFLQKRTKTSRLVVKSNSFVRFLEEIDDPKNLF